MREIAKRARREDLPDPMANPHSKGDSPRGKEWPQWVQNLLYGALFFGLAAAAVFLGLDRWRRATLVLGLTLIYLGALRQVLPDSILGVFSVRSRRFDLWFCGFIGVLMVFLAASVDALGS